MAGISVIVPAHNEANVIERTLRSVLESHVNGGMQLVVVANGCTDDTAARARALDARIEVIETPIAGKAHALQLGDSAARYPFRAYVDADVRLSPHALRGVIDALRRPDCHVAAPRARHVYEGRNPLLAGYYRLWRSLPYVRSSIPGGGFYAIDAELRARFDAFPPVLADDRYVTGLAASDEQRIVEGEWVEVRLPRTFAALLRVKTRWTLGNLEADAVFPTSRSAQERRYRGVGRHVLVRPWHWLSVPTFLCVFLYTRRAARQQYIARGREWATDDTSRAHAGAPRATRDAPASRTTVTTAAPTEARAPTPRRNGGV